MIQINNLVKQYGKTTAVDNLSLEIYDGEIFALLGLNGSGKSTTIKILCSLLQKTSGKVFVNGLDLDKDAEKIKSIINLSPQETAVANNLTCVENLDLIATLYDVNDKDKAIENMLETFSLKSKTNSKAKTLSAGQKRRLSLAMALITNPQILFLDEPTLGLDIKSRKELWKIISSCKGKTTVILTTHYLEEAENLADRIAIISKGKLVTIGTAKEIVEASQQKDFENAFLSLVGDEDEET